MHKLVTIVLVIEVILIVDLVLSASVPIVTKRGGNDRYPLTLPILTENGNRYRIGLIADLDENSRGPGNGKYYSYLKRGYLTIKYNKDVPKDSKINIDWDIGDPQLVVSGYSFHGRGMELSELNTFDNNVVSCDDRTGIIFKFNATKIVKMLEPSPWIILADGNGEGSKGFKCEWGTVKDEFLYIGSHGTFTVNSTGQIVGYNNRYTKKISLNGLVTHIDWNRNYDQLLDATGRKRPGYLTHESGGWSDIHQKWLFLPRKASDGFFQKREDEQKGTNLMIFANDEFTKFEVRHGGPLIPSHGFSSFKWIPESEDELIVAVKSIETIESTESFVTVLTMNGDVVYPETKVANYKIEGIEFI